MNARGFTLVELLVVIAIMTIVMAIGTLDFNSMMKKGQIEKQIHAIHSDLVAKRIESMQRKQRNAVFFGPKKIIYRSYDSNAEPLNQGQVVSTVNYPFEIQRLSDGSLAPLNDAVDHVEYDTRGYTNDNITLVALPLKYNEVDNCILVSTSRTNIGRMVDASTCTAR